MYFKKYILSLLMVIAACSTKAAVLTDSTLFHKIRVIADEVSKKMAPDKRTVVFKYVLSNLNQPEIQLETTLPAAAENLKSAFTSAGMNVMIKTNLLPAAELGSKIYGVVRLSVSNNRKDPWNAAEMMTQMLLGTPVHILKKEKGYSLVRSPDQYISWVDNEAIATMDVAEFENWTRATKLIYTADYGFSYSAPDVKSLRVSDLVKGDIIKVLGKEKGFYKIVYPDQRIAYIAMKDAENYKQWAARPNPNADQILNTAKTLMGVPYLWGGTSVKGVDCSGFTKTSYFLNGIILPRDASQQALVGQSVDIYEADTVNLAKSLKNLQPGDLLFFAASKGKMAKPRVTHTAIYMGKGMFIQSAGMVRINSMNPAAADYADYQTRTLVSARRMLNAIGTPEIKRIDQHEFYNLR